MIKVLSDMECGYIFQTELYTEEHMEMYGAINPYISFSKNHDGKVCLNFHHFNVDEMIDGYTIEQSEELMNTIAVAKQYAIDMRMDESQNLLFEQEESNKGDMMINRNNDTFIIKLIELSTECIDTYEKYLLDQTDHNSLAKKMKQLRTHVSKFMGMNKIKASDNKSPPEDF